MKRAFPFFAISALLLLTVYIGLFSFWWLSAKKTVAVVSGQKHVALEVHQTHFMYHTQPIWEPAFWFMEHVGGYHRQGYIAAEEDSAFVYTK